jgi:ASC-1-like (ASCH) protein
MKFEIDLKDKKYSLKVDDRVVFESDKLSDIVRKIEAYAKLRFLPEPVKLGFMERIKGVVDGSR